MTPKPFEVPGRNPGTGHDAIMATKLPTNLLTSDLRQTLLGHFANFGRILRFSCAQIKGEKTAHIQYSNANEAQNALTNGKIMNGHCLTIRTTDKHPSTQLMSVPPVASRSSTPTFPGPQPSASTPRASPSPSASNSRPNQQQQQTLDSFILQGTKEKKPGLKLDSKPVIHGTCSSSAEEPVAGPSTGGRRASFPQEEKPKLNTCVKVEVYTPPPSISLSTSALIEPRRPQLIRSRSLRDVFYFDIPGMKVVKNGLVASDALACQFFTGGAGRHPFPLAMMFGRAPGSVIMPVNCIMDGITRGLEIKPSTLELIWNSLETSVINATVRESVEKIIKFEKGCSSLLPSFIEEILDDHIPPSVLETAEQEMSLEEDRLIICEDVLDDIIGAVCRTESAELEEARAAELERARACGETATSYYEGIETTVVEAIVEASAREVYTDELCNDVIDELLGFYLEDWLGVLASAFVKSLENEELIEKAEPQIAAAYRRLEKSGVKAAVKKVALDEFMNTLYGEVVEDLLECGYFSLCVKVVAQNVLKECKEEAEALEAEAANNYEEEEVRQRRTEDWLRALPNSQSSIESNYVSPPPPSSSSSSSNSSQEIESLSSCSNSSQEIESSPLVQLQMSLADSSQNQSVSAEPSSPTLTAGSETERLSMVPVEEPNPGPVLRLFRAAKRKANSFCGRLRFQRPRLE